MVGQSSSERLTWQIELPSFALTRFLKAVVFDDELFRLFDENPRQVIANNAVHLDPTVGDRALSELQFIVFRLRNYIKNNSIDLASFENVFCITAREQAEAGEPSPDLPPEPWVLTDSSVAGGVSATDREVNRGRNYQFTYEYDAVTDRETSEYHTTSFSGVRRAPDGMLQERFIETPLLDLTSITRLTTLLDIRLRELGRY